MIYLATFYTHAAALFTQRALVHNGITARLMPVPRDLSSSCGTCVRYEASNPCYDLLDRDTEQVTECTPSGYVILKTYE